MFDQIIYVKQILVENKELMLKSGVTILASSLSQIQIIDSWVRLGASIIALIVGILTIFKLSKELFRKNNKQDKKQ